MKHAMISTWARSYKALCKGFDVLKTDAPLHEAILTAVQEAENDPEYNTVGYGGIPNREGIVQLDAAYMCGDDLRFGAVMGTIGVKNPILVAHDLSKYARNNVLCGEGASRYAMRQGFEMANLLTEESRAQWLRRLKEDTGIMRAYEDNHDTVCVIGALDGHLDIGVSTSGLGMKEPGRVGDSPIIGSGLYADSEVGAAAATGLGEDIMKGCLSYEIVRLMKGGMPVQKACETAVWEHCRSFARRGWTYDNMAVIALDRDGNFGAAANHDFPFVYCCDGIEPQRWNVTPNGDGSCTLSREDD